MNAAKNLSEPAKLAIIGARANREGAPLAGGVSDSVRQELAKAEMIGFKGGLTARGVAARIVLTDDIPF